jgi:FAD/FMN-containing dehydrogenase
VFERARRGFNRRFDEVVPQAIVRCRTAGDVSAAIGFAAAHDLKLAVRSGGHCFAGNSATEGLLIDTSPMRAIVMHNDVAVIGAGARLGEAYATLGEHGRTVPGGTCPSVGLSGLALGGGLGILGRRYGVTSDRMVAAQVVLADGELMDCDERRHPDLLTA